jgi:hypothetical protein
MTATDNRKTIVGRSTYRQNKQLLARNAHWILTADFVTTLPTTIAVYVCVAEDTVNFYLENIAAAAKFNSQVKFTIFVENAPIRVPYFSNALSRCNNSRIVEWSVMAFGIEKFC